MILSTHVARQLWVQLRLLPLLTFPSLAALAAVVATDAFGLEGGRAALAIGSALSTVLGAALVGAGFAEEIGSGAAAWLVVRAVPRRALAAAWLVVPSLAFGIAFVLAGILSGLALPPIPNRPSDPVTVGVSMAAIAAPAIPLIAVAMVIATRVGPGMAMAATVVVGAVAAVPIMLIGQSAVHPASGYWLVAGLVPADRPIGVGLQAIGLCLALAAAAWVVAARLFSRRDL